MSDRIDKRLSWFSRGVIASAVLHVAVAATLLIKLPDPVEEPRIEETVSVSLVPPPEEPPAEADKSAAQAEQRPPEPTPQEKQAEEKKAEEKKAEEQKAAAEPPKPEPPKPEPPKPAEQAKAEEPPPPPPAPEPPKPEEKPAPEQKPEQQQPQEDGAGGQEEAAKLQILRPVFAFGEKNAGPREAKDGNATTDPGSGEADPARQPAEAPPQAKPMAEEKPSETAAEPAERPPGQAMPEDIALPEADLAGGAAQKGVAGGDPAAEPLPDLPGVNLPKQPKLAESAQALAPAPKAAKTLFSQSSTGDDAATTAMGDLPRDQRADQLCVTELREQLRHATPAYRPELLPSYRLKSGNVLDVRKAAFRSDRQWFNIAFRCEVDDKATKVLSFGFTVGSAIPRGEWKSRGFPEF